MSISIKNFRPLPEKLTGNLSVLLLSSLLAACGGGESPNKGDGDDGGTGPEATVPDQPTLTMQPQRTKSFQFNWEPVSGATEYRLLENVDGVSGYQQVASIDGDSTGYGLTVFLPEKINAGYMLQACNSVGCADSAAVSVSGNLAEAIGFIKASNIDSGDYFGINLAVSADGTTMAVAADAEASAATGINGDQGDNSAGYSGAVYIYRQEQGLWRQQAYVKASNAEAGDVFGSALALSADGNLLAVGAVGESSTATGVNGDQADNGGDYNGAVYLFAPSNGAWQQQAYLKASNTEVNDSFGSEIALSADGKVLAVGAKYEDSSATGSDGDQASNDAEGSGAVYMFVQQQDGQWRQQAYLKASYTDADDQFGHALALSGDGGILAVGVPGEDGVNAGDNAALNSGAVYVFERYNDTWLQQRYLKAFNSASEVQFGWDVALSADGDTLAVGAIGESSDATGVGGDQFNSRAPYSGAVYVFQRDWPQWHPQAYLKASNTRENAGFGTAVSLSADGQSLAVSSPRESSTALGINGDQNDGGAAAFGAAYLFTQYDGVWQQQAYLKSAANTGPEQFFGLSLALSGNGKTLAVSAIGEGSGTGDLSDNSVPNSAPNSGAVYLY